MTNPISLARIEESIKSFDWYNYGLDDIGFILDKYFEDQDWVPDLAAHIFHGFVGDEAI